MATIQATHCGQPPRSLREGEVRDILEEVEKSLSNTEEIWEIWEIGIYPAGYDFFAPSLRFENTRALRNLALP